MILMTKMHKYKVIQPRMMSGNKKGDIINLAVDVEAYGDGFGGIYERVRIKQ